MYLSAENIKKNYGMKQLLDGVTVHLSAGEKLGLIGVNGTGKSTLLKILAGVAEPDEGAVRLDPNIRAAYLAQTPEMNPENTVLEEVFAGYPAEARALDEYEAKTILNRLGIADFDQKIGVLSGGQRKRVALATVFAHPADVLILDEPTNHLDIASREWVEAAIEEFEGVLLFVSHDRYFIEKFAERIWLLEDGKIRDFPCGYQKYRSILEHEAAAKPAVSAAPKPKKERAKGGTKDADKLVRRLEREIEKQEQVVADFDRKIEAASADYQELTRLLGEKEEAEAALMDLMEQWEQVQT